MLSRAQRLTVRDFAVAFEKGRVLRHPLLQVRFYQRQSDQKPFGLRAAFVAPKKIGNAVIRNKVRRRVRERFRLLCAAEKTPIVIEKLKNCDLLFMAHRDCETATTSQIDEALSQLLKRVAGHVSEKVA